MKEQVNIICLYWKGEFRGRDFTHEDVYNLRDQVDANIDRHYKFYCLTNDMTVKTPKIELINNWPGWWSKMELHRPDLPCGRTLYLDLDTHIVNSLEPILDYEGDLVMFRSPYTSYRKTIVRRYQASVMLFTPAMYTWLYDRFKKLQDMCMLKFRSDQDLMGKWIPDQPVFPDEWLVKHARLRTRSQLKKAIVVTGQPKGCDFREFMQAPWLEEAGCKKGEKIMEE